MDLVVAAALALLLLPVKTLLFHALLAGFRLRARTALLSSLALANYSEFGLIVTAVGVSAGWISQQWLMIMALSLSISFILSSILNARAHSIYPAIEHILRRYQSRKYLPGDEPADIGDAEILVVGMGRVGSGAYLSMREKYGHKVWRG